VSNTNRKGRVYNCPPGILLPAQALGGEPRQVQRASERQPPGTTSPSGAYARRPHEP
jgi:hypothetical protein